MFSFRSKPHDFTPQLEALLRDGEELDDKVKPREFKSSELLRMRADTSAYPHPETLSEGAIKRTGTGVLLRTFACKGSDAREEILQLVAEMAQVREDHVQRLIGAVTTSKKQIMAVLENPMRGTVPAFLERKKEEHNGSVPMETLLRIATDVATGMAALDDVGVVHGALQAANVYVAEAGAIFKVGDWLHKHAEPTHGRWMAPELHTGGVITPQTDVWAFGVVMYELFSQGKVPHPDLPANDISDKVLSDDPYPQPELADDGLFAVMKACWDQSPDSRPDFCWLRAEFEDRAEAAAES